MHDGRSRQVLIIGGADDRENLATAYFAGAAVARLGATLITGGRGGVMEAASRGARDGGGPVVGILPGDDAAAANPYCTIVIPTGLGHARNHVNVLAADIVIAIGGKAGTLSELAFAWLHRKPVICCTFTGGWSSRFPQEPPDDRPGSAVYQAQDRDSLLAILSELLGAGSP